MARDPDSRERLEEAVELQSNQEPDIVFVSKEGSKVPAHRSVVSLFCPLVRDTVPNVPPHLTPTFLMTDTSMSCLVSLVGIFYTGVVSGVDPGNDNALAEIEETGKLLGFVIKLRNDKPKQILKVNEDLKDDTTARENLSSPEFEEDYVNSDPELTCKICNETLRNMSGIWVHYISKHYMKALKFEFKDLANVSDKTCKVCSKESSTINALFIHIGVKHEKLDFLLQRDGYPKLPKRRTKVPKLNQKDSTTNIEDEQSAVKMSPRMCHLCTSVTLTTKIEYMEHLSSAHYWSELVGSFGNKYTKMCILCKAKHDSLPELAKHIGVFHKIAEDYIPEDKSEVKPKDDWQQKVLDQSKRIKEMGHLLAGTATSTISPIKFQFKENSALS